MKKIALLLFISVSSYSCYSPRYVYTPTTQNIPLLQKKNDLEFSGFYTGSLNVFNGKDDYNHGFEVHAAWAVSNHFAAMFNESFGREKNNGNDSFYPGDSSLLSYKKNFTEIGFGYFSRGTYNAKMQFQLFGGTAFGTSNIYDDYTSNNTTINKYHQSNVTKIFIQPAIIYSPVKNFSGAISSRFTEVVFTHIHTNYTASELNNYILDSLTTSPVFFWEPAVSYALGFKKFPLKIQVQGSISILLNHRFVEHRTANLAIGLVADFAKRRIRGRSAKN